MSKRALCIGINDCPGTKSDLSGCVNDAKDWAADLGQRGFIVTSMHDAQATKAAMTAGIRGVISGAKLGDTVVITYSGHGTWVPDKSGDEPDGRDEGLCPYDIGTAGPLLDEDLRALIDGRASGVKLILIADSCHSGSVNRGSEQPLDASEPRPRYLPPEAWMDAEALPRARLAPTRVTGSLRSAGGDLLMAGCQDKEYSWDTKFKGRPNGAFTYYALKALHERSPANYQAWYDAVREYLPGSVNQTPQIAAADDMKRAAVFA